MNDHRRRLATFDPSTEDIGGPRWKLALWFAIQEGLWSRWWFPRRMRPRLLRRFGADVADSVVIREHVYIHVPWRLIVGADAWIGRGVEIYNHEWVRIEGDASIPA